MLLLVDPCAWQLLLHPQLQVLGAVVVADAVLVVDLLMRQQIAAENLFHDQAVLKDESISAMLSNFRRMIRCPHFNSLYARVKTPVAAGSTVRVLGELIVNGVDDRVQKHTSFPAEFLISAYLMLFRFPPDAVNTSPAVV